MPITILPYAQWKKENHLALLEKCYETYGPRIDEYEYFVEAEYAKASKTHRIEGDSPAPRSGGVTFPEKNRPQTSWKAPG